MDLCVRARTHTHLYALCEKMVLSIHSRYFAVSTCKDPAALLGDEGEAAAAGLRVAAWARGRAGRDRTFCPVRGGYATPVLLSM